MADVVTFGEAMIRLVPPNFQRLEQTSTLDVQVGGGELNVAVGVSRLGLKSAWISRLPKNALGRLMLNRVRQAGVDASHIVWSDGDRMGLYFVEFGAAPRASSVLYDRVHSAISAIQPGEVDWKRVCEGATWFHTSGITPALSESAAAVTREALVAAKQAGATVSYDLNYRGKLWPPDKAQAVQEPLMEFVDVLITTEEDTSVVLRLKRKARPTKRDSPKSPPTPTRKLRRSSPISSISRPWRSPCARIPWCGATPGRPSPMQKVSITTT